MGNKNFGKIKSDLLRYLSSRPGQMVFVEDMAKDTKWSVHQIQQSMYGMRRNNSDLERQILVIHGGRAWRYMPDNPARFAAPKEVAPADPPPVMAEPTPPPVVNSDRDLYEQVGVTKKGTVLVQDLNGQIFKLVELDA